MERDHVVYLGSFSVSKMDAQSQLVIGNSLILRELGYQVTLIDNDPQTGNNSDPQKNKVNVEKGFDCYTIAFHKSFRELLSGKKMQALKAILQHIGFERIKYIICYGSLGYANLLFEISQLCERNRIVLLYNCVDIPEMNHGNTIQRIVKKTDRWLLHQAICRRARGLIVVTSYIKDYFAKRSDYPIVVIPPLRDTTVIPEVCAVRGDGIRHIVYVGIPFPIDGRQVSESAYKDRIDLFIDLLAEIEDIDYRLDIYGLEKEQYIRVVHRHAQTLNKLGDKIIFHGRIKHSEAIEVVRKADFTINYRVRNQMTMAGFSTKFVESVSCGTPPIVTDTSEYSSYCGKGADIIILNPDDHNSQLREIRRCLSLTDDEIQTMKVNCYRSRLFDYRGYVNALGTFLDIVDRQTRL